MDGKEVTGYHLQSMDNGKAGRYTREQVAFLVGKGQVTNCQGQIYQDKVILRGVGMSLDDLPVQQENGTLSRTAIVGKVRKGATAADVMTQFVIVGCITNGRNTVGYIIRNAAGQTKQISREDALRLSKDGKVGNARVQEYNGRILLRGVGVNLNELPVTQVNKPKEVQVPQKLANRRGELSKKDLKDLAEISKNMQL